jgi:hypothetical protein
LAIGEGQIVVSQLGTSDLSDKEPTLEGVSRETAFLGERTNVALWDDVETSGVVTPEARAALRAWWETRSRHG